MGILHQSICSACCACGHFDVLRRSMARLSPDMRIQAVIVAFCFGALLEALAGFGTPVARWRSARRPPRSSPSAP